MFSLEHLVRNLKFFPLNNECLEDTYPGLMRKLINQSLVTTGKLN